ncbi:MAG TPA: hypothetical protein PKW07_11660 [Syntrophorhabdaceae bacterium]|nr:hypothetical protein [Syntrophorhabdaceae bacterium]
MNKVFISGTISSDMEIYYSPKGEKIVIFSLFVEEGRFYIEVIYKDTGSANISDLKKTDKAVLSGVLTKATKGAQDFFRLEADKLFVMEV